MLTFCSQFVNTFKANSFLNSELGMRNSELKDNNSDTAMRRFA